MLFDSSRDSLRQQWLDAWQRAQAGAILTPLESSLAQLIQDHPEYHGWLQQGDRAVHADFLRMAASRTRFYTSLCTLASANKSPRIVHPVSQRYIVSCRNGMDNMMPNTGCSRCSRKRCGSHSARSVRLTSRLILRTSGGSERSRMRLTRA